ncbi:MAG: cadherin-like beta sandwich domain-containing protein [Bacillota bacterium]|nr:cadherin-like beta sandwich domain-containing protein [Bacillota bacterium]
MKKVLSIILVLTLVLATTAFSAFAAGTKKTTKANNTSKKVSAAAFAKTLLQDVTTGIDNTETDYSSIYYIDFGGYSVTKNNFESSQLSFDKYKQNVLDQIHELQKEANIPLTFNDFVSYALNLIQSNNNSLPSLDDISTSLTSKGITIPTTLTNDDTLLMYVIYEVLENSTSDLQIPSNTSLIDALKLILADPTIAQEVGFSPITISDNSATLEQIFIKFVTSLSSSTSEGNFINSLNLPENATYQDLLLAVLKEAATAYQITVPDNATAQDLATLLGQQMLKSTFGTIPPANATDDELFLMYLENEYSILTGNEPITNGTAQDYFNALSSDGYLDIETPDGFNSDYNDYTLNVDANTTSVPLYISTDLNSTVTVNGTPYDTDNGEMTVDISNTNKITVVATDDSGNKTTYTFNVVKSGDTTPTDTTIPIKNVTTIAPTTAPTSATSATQAKSATSAATSAQEKDNTPVQTGSSDVAVVALLMSTAIAAGVVLFLRKKASDQ